MFVGGSDQSELLVQADNGQFNLITRPSAPSPTGKWPAFFSIDNAPAHMNGKGNIPFLPRGPDVIGGTSTLTFRTYLGAFLWDATTRQSSTLALPSTPVAGDLTIVGNGGNGLARAAINNSDEVAFPSVMRNAAGRLLGQGIYLRGRTAPSSPSRCRASRGAMEWRSSTRITPRSTMRPEVGLLARRPGDTRPSGYVWESGSLTPVAVVGSLPDGGTIAEVAGVWVNNKNRNVLVEVVLNHLDTGPHALYLWVNGTLAPVVVPGQPMPGSGRFTSLQGFGRPWGSTSVSFANDLGQHAFFGRVLEGNKSRWAAFLLNSATALSPRC